MLKYVYIRSDLVYVLFGNKPPVGNSRPLATQIVNKLKILED